MLESARALQTNSCAHWHHYSHQLFLAHSDYPLRWSWIPAVDCRNFLFCRRGGHWICAVAPRQNQLVSQGIRIGPVDLQLKPAISIKIENLQFTLVQVSAIVFAVNGCHYFPPKDSVRWFAQGVLIASDEPRGLKSYVIDFSNENKVWWVAKKLDKTPLDGQLLGHARFD